MKARDDLSTEVGRIIADTLAISTKIGQQHNPEVALRILMTAELRLLRKAIGGPSLRQTMAQTHSSAWKVQPDMDLYPVQEVKP